MASAAFMVGGGTMGVKGCYSTTSLVTWKACFVFMQPGACLPLDC